MNYTHAYHKQLTARAKAYEKKMLSATIPEELAEHFDYDRLNAVNFSVWRNGPVKRPFSPLIKDMTDNVISVAGPYSAAERAYIKDVAHILYETYGEPVFKYSGTMSSENLRVKEWQSLLQLSPKYTQHASKRRFENFANYLDGSSYNPDINLMKETCDIVSAIINIPTIKIDHAPKYVRSLFAQHTSNVGYPFYAREDKVAPNGLTYRQWTVEITSQLNKKYGTDWMLAIPALIIGRDQQGKMDFDLSRDYTFEQLLAYLDTVSYKPSKARVVWAVDRISNNNINPVVKAIITHPQFLTNPTFCGFKSREDRAPLYKNADALAKQLGKIVVNLDFSGHDYHLSPEIIILAYDLLFENIDFSNSPKDLADNIIAKTIFTKYILFNPTNGNIEYGHKSKAIPSGIGTTGIIGLLCALIALVYATIRIYGVKWWHDMIEHARSHNTFVYAGLGDDALIFVDKFDDVAKIANIVEEAFGMVVASDPIKTAVGVDFLQEVYENQTVSYPVGRMLESALYVEKEKGLGWAEWVMVWFSQLYNLRGNNEADLINATRLILKWDRSKLGQFDPSTNKSVSRAEFLSELKRELSLHDTNAKQQFWDGDPSKESKFTENGDFKSSYLNWCFSLVQKATDYSNDKGARKWKKI